MHIFEFQYLLNGPLKVKIFLTNTNLPIGMPQEFSNTQISMNIGRCMLVSGIWTLWGTHTSLDTQICILYFWSSRQGWHHGTNLSTVTVGEGRVWVNFVCVLREALWAIYRTHRRHTPKPKNRGKDYTTLDYYTPSLTPPLKCNVNAMTLHLESWY